MKAWLATGLYELTTLSRCFVLRTSVVGFSSASFLMLRYTLLEMGRHSARCTTYETETVMLG